MSEYIMRNHPLEKVKKESDRIKDNVSGLKKEYNLSPLKKKIKQKI